MTVLSMSRAEIDRGSRAEGVAGRADTTERSGAADGRDETPSGSDTAFGADLAHVAQPLALLPTELESGDTD